MKELETRLVTDEAERKEVIECYFCDGEHPDDYHEIFAVKDDCYGEIVYFKTKRGFYHTIIERDSVYTQDIEVLERFIREFQQSE